MGLSENIIDYLEKIGVLSLSIMLRTPDNAKINRLSRLSRRILSHIRKTPPQKI